MTDSLCSCCRLFGKPRARVNFIILAGAPDSVVYQRIKYLLQNYQNTNLSTQDTSLTNYDTLMTISSHSFDLQNQTSPIDSSTMSSTDKCCHGYFRRPFHIDDASNPTEWETFQKSILDLLNAKMDENVEERSTNVESASWVLLHGSICLEPELLNVFIKLKDQNLTMVTYTFTVLGLLVSEQQLFENWLCRNLAIENYQNKTYPEYEKRNHAFFSLLNSSKYLQENTLLVEENKDLTDNKLEALLKNVFQHDMSNYRAVNHQLRSNMERLLRPRHRTARDIRSVRGNLQASYQKNGKNQLESLLNCLKRPETAANAARQVVHLLLDEFSRLNKEQRRAYKRQLLCGFEPSDPENSNTITAQLVHYALRLLQNYEETTIPFLYSIIMVICETANHYVFRHELFNHTPEIYTLSMLLVSQRHYALTLGGLHLCSKILNADQNEHKYASAYLTHDPLTARKILDAIKWLLSPYLELRKLWNEEDEKKASSESNNDQSPSNIATKHCFQYTGILLDQAHLRSLASLFYGSFDHCMQVTEDDVHQIVEAIEALTDSRLTRWGQGENRSHLSLLFVIDLCTFLTPILLHGRPKISLVLINETRLLTLIPRTISMLLRDSVCKMDAIDVCLRFYTRLIESKYKQGDITDDDSDDEEDIKTTPTTTIEPIIQPMNSLYLTKDLLSSYYDLYRQFQKSILFEKNSAQQKQLQALFETEWKKIDILQLKHDYDQLKKEHQSIDEKLAHLRDELQRTQSERDQLQREKMQMAQEIDRLKLATPTNVIVQSAQILTNVSITKNINDQTNIIDQLRDLLPHQIKTEQAEQFIQEIYHRLTTFDDPDMRKSICGSLKQLGSDLYSSSVHFLHELIQNAEDNIYVKTVTPYLRIELNHNYILLSNNEQGLCARHVLAICSLAVSTKSIEQKHIGEKGVGFKSVFAASNQPTLISHSWKFRFQVPGPDAMSYITPLWIHDEEIPECIFKQISTNRQHTHLYLPLKIAAHTSLAEQFLNDVARAVDPCILLNMRQLKKLEIVDRRQEKITIIEKQPIGATKLQTQATVIFEDLTFLDLTGSMIQLCTRTGDRTFRVYECQIDVPSAIEQRGNPTTSLILAFPCEHDYDLNATVYAGLPVCDLGFNFMFNAEFHLVTSRENVRENVPFNTYVRDHLAVLFVYLLLNDIDLKKDISRYCPLSNIHQVKHSSWWLSMIDRINELITKHLSVLFDIRTGKLIRYWNPDLISLVSKEQLYNYANIQVIDSNDEFFTADRLKSFQIQTVSMKDVLECFPNRDDQTNAFHQWTQEQDERWWSQFFHHLSEGMTSDISSLILQKPIFILQDNRQRQYLPKMTETSSLLFINDDQSIRMWKRRLTLLRYASPTERTALLLSNQVQFLTEERLIDTILQDHLELSLSSMMTPMNDGLLDEIWKDLSYLQSRVDKLDKSKPILVPIQGSSSFTLIQNTTLPTIFGLDIKPFINCTTVTFVHVPYYNIDHNPLIHHLQWEYFLLKMNCKPPSIHLPENYSITRLPLLPLFTMFTEEKYARLGEFIFSVQTENTQKCLRQFPIVAQANTEEQIRPISTTFDQSIITDLPALPRINLPSYCRSLAIQMDVCADYDVITCVTILQYSSTERITNVDLYIEWLGRLQLEVRQKNKTVDNNSLLSACHLYLPDQQQFCSLKDLLVISDNNDQYRQGILLVCKYLKLHLISPTTNQTYWQFKDLFRILGCQCTVSIANICLTIDSASNDKHNFYPLGDHLTTLTENGTETMITLFQYLNHSILQCVAECAKDTDLYRFVIENKHPKAFCGSREDFQWRFALISKQISSELKKLTGIQFQNQSLPLLTINRQLIAKKSTNIMYACFETKLIQNLSRTPGKRHFISPIITQTCPLVLAMFEIDYVERRGKLEWVHQNINLEYKLSQLTQIFQDTTGDNELEVASAKYAEANLFISDVFVIDTIDDDDDDDNIEQYRMESDYPFWIFNKTILLCTGNIKDDSSRAIIAISALATLLHKRKHVPFEEAKLIARQKIGDCTKFRSSLLSNIASTTAKMYSYMDLVFPTDHQAIESMTISIGRDCTIEQDPEEIGIDPVRFGEDQIYRSRAEQQNHRDQNRKTTDNWMNPAIVDGAEHIRIGQNAEHFFFVYLQKLYGAIDVTPTKNWRSSSRLKVYPQYTRDIDDALGYDFELHDTKEYFVRGTKSTTKKCYFEVKGTSGSFHKEHTSFHISQNELETCQSIVNNSRRKEQAAYLLVIIEHCLDPEKIALGKIINWSSDFNMVEGRVDSYHCKLRSSPSVHTTQDNHENINNDDVSNRKYEHQYESNRSYDNYQNYEYHQSTSTKNEASNYHRDNTPPYRNQQQRQKPLQQHQQEQRNEFYERGRGRGRGRGRVNNTNAQDFNWRR